MSGGHDGAPGDPLSSGAMPQTVALELGPLPPAAVLAFVDEVEELLAVFAADDDLRVTFTPTIADGIRTYLTEWRAAARGDAFAWQGPLDAAAAEYLLYATFLGVDLVRRTNGGAPLADERSNEGRSFLRTLIRALHDGLTGVDDVDQDRLAYLESRWPPDLYDR